MWFPRPAEEFSDGVFEYIDKKIEEIEKKQGMCVRDDEEWNKCDGALEVLREMRDYFRKYPYWE